MEVGLILTFIILLGELLKRQGMNPKLTPLINAVIGIASSVISQGLTLESVIHGLSLGLIACGVYDQTKICKLSSKGEMKHENHQ